jgi:N-acetylmuramoyl-L-alanine amidase
MTLRKRTDFLVVHCSATRPEMDIDVNDIRRWHKNKGWADVGYHYVIPQSGNIQEGRPEQEIGAHVQGYNARSVGICLVGGLDGNGDPCDNFTGFQKDGLAALLADLKTRYPGATILGHRDLSPDLDGDGVVEKHEWLKHCPCFDVRDWARKKGL